MRYFLSPLGLSCTLFLGSFSSLLTGCGAGVSADSIVQADVPNSEFHGQLNGGQNPITGATISVYEMGTGGYGSAATLKASTTTDSAGKFSFASGAYSCSQNNAPTYLLSTGGNTGSGINVNATLGVSLGTCQNGKSPTNFFTMNEVTTVALAYALSHYFNTTIGGTAPTNDNFGGPSSGASGSRVYSKGLVLANSTMIPLIATASNGYAAQSSSTVTTEEQKIYYMANILAACVNSAGQTSTTETTSACGKLFNYTMPPGGTVRPSDTLQAAVMMALYPTQNVMALFNSPGTKVAFGTTMSAQPADWSLTASFTSSSLGLSVDTGTLSTIDIDSSNRIWFPSNSSGGTGLAYFDPTTRTFSSAYNSTGMVHPNQVAIDNNGYAWVSDTQGAKLSAYNTASPATALPFTIANTKSYTVTVGSDSSIRTGLYDSAAGKYRLGTIPSTGTPLTATGGTYTELTTPALLANYVPVSMAFDNTGTLEFAQFLSTTPRIYHSQLTSTSAYQQEVDTTADNLAQVLWNGSSLIGIRSFNNGAGAGDGLCVSAAGAAKDAGTCYSVKSPNYAVYTGAAGAVADGAKTVWVANSVTSSVTQSPIYSGNAYNQTVGSAQQIATNFYTHSTSATTTVVGGVTYPVSASTAPMPAPEGIAVDNAGNVWVANAGCTTTGCTPGAFVLSVLIGAGAPTVTPLAAQVVSGASLAGTEPTY